MKMPSKFQLCGHCGQAVLHHKNSINIGGQLYHRKKCFAKFVKALSKQRRKLVQEHKVPS